MNPLAVIAQSPSGDDHVSRSLRLTAEAALQEGCRLLRAPVPLSARDVDAVLEPLGKGPGPACFSGFLPHPGAYIALDWGLRQKGREPLNSSKEMRRAMDFSHWYPAVEDLTAESVVVASERDLREASSLGFPLFVKGTVKSNKEQGLAACLAGSEQELRALVAEAAPSRVVARELLPLRKTGEERQGFPVSREYRVYLYQGRELGHGYYWSERDPFELTRTEREEMLALARLAAARLDVPLLAVDVGQLEDGSWRVVEVGDPQFSGVAHMRRTTFWTRLKELVEG